MRKIFLILVLCASALNAETIFLSQSGSGTGTGINASNRASAAFFNNSANWGVGAGKISAADTVSMSGNVTTRLVFQGSGTTGNVITLLFESGATMSNPAWNPGAITTNGNDYLVIDGGTNGIVENTDNGTSLANKVDSSMVQITNGSNNITVQNLIIRNVYVRTGTSEALGNGCGVELTNGYSAIRVTNCTVSHSHVGIGGNYDIISDIEFDHNTVTNANWGMRLGDRNSASVASDIRIHHNSLSLFSNWDDNVNNTHHHNGIYLWAESDGNIGNILIYANTIGPDFGLHATAGYFSSGIINGYTRIYNNLFICNSGDAPSNDMITIGLQSAATGTVEIYNNTFIGGDAGRAMGLGPGGTSWNVRNNIFYNWPNFMRFSGTPTGTITFNHNLFYLVDTYDAGSLAAWQAQGYDLDAIVANPLFVGGDDYSLQSISPARDAGVSISGVFTVDRIGTARPQGSAWDIGAYEFVVGGPDTTPPTVTSSSINSAGTVLTLNFSETVSIGLGGNGGMTITASGVGVAIGPPTVGGTTITYPITGRVIGVGETVTRTYAQPGNGIEDAALNDLASFTASTVTNTSSQDITAPTPNPSTFSAPPSTAGSTSITMTATTATDASSPPVQYFFDETSGNPGGTDSGFQSSPTYVDAGLQPGTQYTYRVQARDAVLNTTTFSSGFSATTTWAAGARPATPGRSQRSNIVNP